MQLSRCHLSCVHRRCKHSFDCASLNDIFTAVQIFSPATRNTSGRGCTAQLGTYLPQAFSPAAFFPALPWGAQGRRGAASRRAPLPLRTPGPGAARHPRTRRARGGALARGRPRVRAPGGSAPKERGGCAAPRRCRALSSALQPGTAKRQRLLLLGRARCGALAVQELLSLPKCSAPSAVRRAVRPSYPLWCRCCQQV